MTSIGDKRRWMKRFDFWLGAAVVLMSAACLCKDAGEPKLFLVSLDIAFIILGIAVAWPPKVKP